MEQIMIVSSTSMGEEMLSGILKSTPYSSMIIAKSAAEARRKLREENVGIVLVNCPLSDEFGIDLAEEISRLSTSAVALIVKSELTDQVEHRAEKFGAFVIPKPLSRQVLFQSMKMLVATRKRIQNLQDENIRLTDILKNRQWI